MPPPSKVKAVFFPLDLADKANACVSEMSRQGMALVHCESGWAMYEGRLCYGTWFCFRPTGNG
jgi:hypothetical protein